MPNSVGDAIYKNDDRYFELHGIPNPLKQQKPPTGSGIIGQTGNKPGGSIAGSVLPPREGICDPRPISGPEIVRHESAAMMLGLIELTLVAVTIGFILGKVL